jgi:hypothetical protein
MNIWEELAALGHYIADNRLRAAWERMVLHRNLADCQLVQEIADDTPDAFLYWKLAYRAEELAEMEQSFAREIIRVKK